MNDNDNDKPFITDDCDMLVTMIMCGVILLIGIALAGFVFYELWHLAKFLLHLALAN